ncbi:PIG-L family deacetylase [Patescibacteria group bacterium]|nr:PIG-L family deacetylase [Patescibacteria group bacterium]
MKQNYENVGDLPPKNANAFFEALKSREIIPGNQYIAFVGAHYDDESSLIGAQIPLMPLSSIIHTTDSAPLDPRFWAEKHASAEEYSAHRRTEVTRALNIAGHVGPRSTPHISDQTAAFNLVELTRGLVEEFRSKKIQIAITHAYEGGHPDHDATAFAVHAAAAILRKEGGSLSIVEAPSYRLKNPDDHDFGVGEIDVNQRFEHYPGSTPVVFYLTPEQIALKQALFAAHSSQAHVMAEMSTDTEQFRVAPNYDFTHAAHGGRLSHIYARNGITPERWSELAGEALRQLGLSAQELSVAHENVIPFRPDGIELQTLQYFYDGGNSFTLKNREGNKAFTVPIPEGSAPPRGGMSLADNVGDVKGKRLLELGAASYGINMFAALLHEAESVYGIEIGPNEAAFLENSIRQLGLEGRAKVHAGGNIPENAGLFGAIIANLPMMPSNDRAQTEGDTYNYAGSTGWEVIDSYLPDIEKHLDTDGYVRFGILDFLGVDERTGPDVPSARERFKALGLEIKTIAKGKHDVDGDHPFLTRSGLLEYVRALYPDYPFGEDGSYTTSIIEARYPRASESQRKD